MTGMCRYIRTPNARCPLTVVTLVFVLFFSLIASGCASQGFTYVDEDASYSIEELRTMAENVPPPDFMGEPVDDAGELRQEQLTDLRAQEGDAAELASLLTDLFPDEQRSVPFYAESATVKDVPSWIVIEAWGSTGGTLDNFRVWVLERDTGRVVFSYTFK